MPLGMRNGYVDANKTKGKLQGPLFFDGVSTFKSERKRFSNEMDEDGVFNLRHLSTASAKLLRRTRSKF